VRVKQKTNSTISAIKSAIGIIPTPHSHLLFIKGYKGVTLMYGKDILTAIFSQPIIGGVKETWLIERDSLKEIDARLDEIKENIRLKLDEALLAFSRQFNIILPFEKVVWSRHEDWIKGEEYIDRLPREVVIHDTCFKKVYGEGIEFIQTKMGEEPTAKIKAYIKNRALEDFTPELVEEMSQIRVAIESFKDEALIPLTEQIKLHLEVQRETLKTLKAIRQTSRCAFKEKQKLIKEDKQKTQEGLGRWL
jgi:hypothetical protein